MFKAFLLFALLLSLFVGCSQHKSKRGIKAIKIEKINKNKNVKSKTPFILVDQDINKLISESEQNNKTHRKREENIQPNGRKETSTGSGCCILDFLFGN